MSYFDNLQSRKFGSLYPRSYIFSSNSRETLFLKSDALETRVTYSNLISTFATSASNNSFVVTKGSQVLLSADTNNINATPNITVYGSLTASSNIRVSSLGNNQILLYQEGTQFSGIGYTGDGLYYQVPSTIGRHIFQAGVSAYTQELMRVQSSGPQAQVGIGLTGSRLMDPNTALKVGGQTVIDGNLAVNGRISLTSGTSNLTIGAGDRFAKELLPTNLVYLSQNNKIDDSLLSSGFNFQYLKAMKNVGIGTRTPMQKLHVQGSFVTTERIGIGTLFPSSRLHAVENSASIPCVRFENNQGGNILESYASLTPVLFVHGNPGSVTIGSNAPAPSAAFTVSGNAVITGNLKATSMNIDTLNILDNSQNTLVTLTDFNTGSQTVKTFNTYIPILSQSPLFVNTICPASGSAVTVDGSLVTTGIIEHRKQIYRQADNSQALNKVQITNALTTLRQLTGYICNWDDGSSSLSLIGQEVGLVLPQATTVLSNGKTGIDTNAIISLLVQAVKELANR